ncbi:hypothetical protein J7E70_08025 [Variovorax paradoxus]|nr:hypothetical protein [Variovorax paradoxus]MBT2300411.1 hypothetical protein [Variovorax paradoxus]
MTDFDRTNSGILSRNDRKEKDTHPDHTGSLNVEGVEYFVNAWVKERKDGSGKFFSLSIKRKDKQPEQRTQQRSAPPPPRRSGGHRDDPDSDVPFAPMASGRGFLSL